MDEKLIGKIKRLSGFQDFNGDINFKNLEGDNFLIASAKQQEHNLSIEIMEKTEIDINETNTLGDNALKFFVVGNDEGCLKKFIEKGGDINKPMYYGYTGLMLASFRGMLNIVKIFIENNAKIDLEDKEGYNCLMHSAMKGHMETFDYIFNNGGQNVLKKKNKWGNTCLIEAVFSKEIDMSKKILSLNDKELNNMVDNEGLTACDWALKKWLPDVQIEEQEEMAKKIKKIFGYKSPNDIEIIQKVKNYDIEGIKKYLDEKEDEKDWNGHSGYDWAIYLWLKKIENIEEKKSMKEKIKYLFKKT